jgi:hypothetical protein
VGWALWVFSSGGVRVWAAQSVAEGADTQRLALEASFRNQLQVSRTHPKPVTLARSPLRPAKALSPRAFSASGAPSAEIEGHKELIMSTEWPTASRLQRGKRGALRPSEPLVKETILSRFRPQHHCLNSAFSTVQRRL